MTDRKVENLQTQVPPNANLKPKAIAQKCPVCNGFGTLKYGTIKCHGCKGRGYVLVPIDKKGEE